jgi:hypothetical protein
MGSDNKPSKRLLTGAEVNLMLEEEERRERENAERAEISQQAADLAPSQPPETNETGNEPSKDATKDAPTPIAPNPKKSGNKNALRHGAYVSGLLPWESREEFEALHRGLQNDWKPVGVLQEEAVLALCQWMWNRRRVILASEISYFRSPVPEGLKTGELCWDDVVAYQCNVPAEVKALMSARIKLADSLSKLSDKISQHYYWTDTTEGKEIQFQLSKMASEVNDLAGRLRTQVFDEGQNIRTAVEEITNLFDQAYQPEEIEKHARLLAMCEREIEKSIKRIMLLKTFSEEFAPNGGARRQPLLDSPPVVPNESPTDEGKIKPTED